MAQRLVTDRLMLRSWHVEDAPGALEVFGHVEVARWLSPIMGQVPDLPAMQLLLQQWIVEDTRAIPPAGRCSRCAAGACRRRKTADLGIEDPPGDR